VHLAIRATFSASAVALVGFGRLSESYYHRCFFSLLSSTVKPTEIWNARRMSAGCSTFKQEKNDTLQCWRFYTMKRKFHRINFILTTLMFLKRKIHKQYHSKLSSVVIIAFHSFVTMCTSPTHKLKIRICGPYELSAMQMLSKVE
jgi:hypothetical protein